MIEIRDRSGYVTSTIDGGVVRDRSGYVTRYY